MSRGPYGFTRRAGDADHRDTRLSCRSRQCVDGGIPSMGRGGAVPGDVATEMRWPRARYDRGSGRNSMPLFQQSQSRFGGASLLKLKLVVVVVSEHTP